MGEHTGNELGQMLRNRRDALGLSRAQLAAMAGVSQEWVKNVETGVQLSPRVELLARATRSLGLEPNDLLTVAGVDTRAYKAQTAIERHDQLNASFLNLQNLSPERFEEAVRYLDTLRAMDHMEFQKRKL